ncbi:MAG: type II secretion system protein [Ketobacteraceae bacterium]|nr:type II secretion system protein [Ketobacteraceae bacterium]
MKRQQSGFTLIELIMVIVILGILSAFAIPKFADLSGDAQESAIQGLAASARSASAITHAAWLASGGTGTTVTLEGSTTVTVNAAGYPEESTAGIGNAIEASGFVYSAGTADSTADYELGASATCHMIYDDDTTPPTVTIDNASC